MSSSSKTLWHFDTIAVHSGSNPKDWNCQPISPPIVTSTASTNAGDIECNEIKNPTRSCLQQLVASLEKAKHGFAVTSGTTTVSTVIQAALSPGDNILLPRDAYYGTVVSLTEVMSSFNITITTVDSMDNINPSIITDNTRMIWVDCPSNPLLRIVDLKKISKFAHEKNCFLVVDGTFMTPYFQQPLTHGVDVVIHSGTKYLNGHGDVLMGLIATNNDKLASSISDLLSDVGSVASPFNCYLMLRGIRTLHVRMKQHQQNAQAVAKYLEKSPFVERVIYPGLPSHPDHELAKTQCTGFGGIVSFTIKGDLENGRKFMKSIKLFSRAVSLGSIESLADHCAIMTRKAMPREDRLAAGIPDNFIRLSVGLEDIEDILNDLDQALEASQSLEGIV